jgi:penicillin amidase
VGFVIEFAGGQPTRLAQAETDAVQTKVQGALKGSICEHYTDDQGIPHFLAKKQSRLGYYACFGYAHGRERAWQMDQVRRIAAGRTAELQGVSGIRTDFIMRLLGLRERAKTLYQSMPENFREYLWAYSLGVRKGMDEALLAGANGAYEFQALGYNPEPWIPEDTVSLLLLQSFDQTKECFQVQIDQDHWKASHPGEEDLFQRTGLPWDTTILKPGEPGSPKIGAKETTSHFAPAGKDSLKEVAELFPVLIPGIGEGSNNWVIAPKLSRSGRAFLANDPHLSLKSPPFWHFLHMESDFTNVIGASLPGVPIIPSGSNENVAWGLTNAYLDSARVNYIEESSEAVKKGETHHPLIWFRFWKFKLPFFFKSFRTTSQGWPLLPLPSPAGKALLLRWTGFDLKPADVFPFLEMMEAKSSRELDESLAKVGIPTWNFVFADTAGEIGYRAVGRIIKNPETTEKGVPDITDRYLDASQAFPEVLSKEEMPHVLSPARGFIATANNPQWQSGAPHFGGRAQAISFRAFRIEELLRKSHAHDLESNRKLQCDVQAEDARFILKNLIRNLKETHTAASIQALEALKSWDFETGEGCRACAIFRAWTGSLKYSGDWNDAALYRLASAEKMNGDFSEEVTKAFRSALEQLKIDGASPLRTWGELHVNSFPHLSGDPLFDDGDSIPTPGDQSTVNPGTSSWSDAHGRWEQTNGASQRLVVELSSPPQVYEVLSGSNQDLATRDLHRNGSEWQKWADCELNHRHFPVNWDVERSELSFQTTRF